VLAKNASGFHICGYNSNNMPELWYFSNIRDLDPKTAEYKNFLPEYGKVSEDFLRRDAKKKFGYNGKNPETARNGVQIYRNGDIRAQVIVWQSCDEIFELLSSYSDFEKPAGTKLDEYEKHAKFRFKFLSSIYKQWCKRSIISAPIDVFAFKS
jgi:hypothetical protein